MTQKQIDLITELYNSIQLEKKEVVQIYEPFRNLRKSSIDFYKVLIFKYGENEILRKDRELKHLVHNHYITDLAQVLKEWQSRGFCKISYLNEIKIGAGIRIKSFILKDVLKNNNDEGILFR